MDYLVVDVFGISGNPKNKGFFVVDVLLGDLFCVRVYIA